MITLSDINWWAVLLATFGYYVLGALWFTPLFGRAWDRSIGYDRAATSRSSGSVSAFAQYVLPVPRAPRTTVTSGSSARRWLWRGRSSASRRRRSGC